MAEINSTVKIDGRGKGTIVGHKSSTNGEIYTVLLDGVDFEVDLPEHRLTLICDTESNNGGTEQTTQARSSRFIDVSESELSDFVTGQKNKATSSKTHYNIKLLSQYLESINETRAIQEIPPAQLCEILCKFFVGVRKSDGSNYEPVTLRGFLSSFDRHLRENDYGYSIVHGIVFAKLKEVLQAKQKQLKSEGLGNQPNKADPITDEEIQQLWENGQLGPATPESIINTLWFFSTVNFGLRGSDEHRDMCWGDISLHSDGTGHEYLQFQERQTKTRQGANPRDVRQVKPKMWANLQEPGKCPVTIYKLYASHRPSDYCKPSDPFYIATHTNQGYMRPGDKWFKRQPIGVNKLTSIMKRMAGAAGLSESKRLTNHSARKHLVQKLSENNVPPNQITQISGHKTIQSVNKYSELSEQQHKQISGILTSNQSAPGGNLALNQFNTNTMNNMNSARQSTSCTFHGGLNNMFAGNIFGGTFNINIVSKPQSPEVPRKRLRLIVDSDSD